ncbi:prolyl-tRNA synthetase associated domain-containing protein [Kordiimonas aquimaris]|uniref:prolyl-tRNA synthetase associated domain-containing protein n=1 Tax=Kordiimonas aquimaris TaxID=707591 RepID=UPI0021CE1902|nr:prolyl-tRNA synthetase associated domain-containing protein [Kordiimonas aquimaris]
MESPATEDMLFDFLDSHGIAHKTYRHKPVFTVEEAQKQHPNMPAGGHSKNLFIRDKKKNYALVVADENLKIDLKALGETINVKRPSFASAERLQAYLGITPGSVTPFALLNAHKFAKDDHPTITVALDQNLMAHDIIYFHPLHNSASTAITPADLIVFVKACGYEPVIF